MDGGLLKAHSYSHLAEVRICYFYRRFFSFTTTEKSGCSSSTSFSILLTPFDGELPKAIEKSLASIGFFFFARPKTQPGRYTHWSRLVSDQ